VRRQSRSSERVNAAAVSSPIGAVRGVYRTFGASPTRSTASTDDASPASAAHAASSDGTR
jgi:hypothetical protein